MIPAYEILTQLVALTRSDATGGPFVDLSGEDGSPGIPDEHIRALSDSYRRDRRDRFAVLPKPGVIYTIQRVSEPAGGGTNNYSYAWYAVVCQIIHSDLEFNDSPVFKSRLKWEYELRRFLMHGNLRNTVNDSSDGILETIHTPTTDQLRAREFEEFDDCVAAIQVDFKVKELHRSSGRT